MKISVMGAGDGTPLKKTFIKNDEGSFDKRSYPQVKNFVSKAYEVTSLQTFMDVLHTFSAEGFCLIKGITKQDLENENRVGLTTADTPTEWLCLDVDGVPGIESAKEFLKLVGLSNVSYIEQLSSSAGIFDEKGYSAHIFILLSEPTEPARIKRWIESINLTALREYMTLNKAGTAFKWPLDRTVCQNDKLIYIADPECVGFPAPELQRFNLVLRKYKRLNLAPLLDNIEDSYDEEALYQALREDAGLPERERSFTSQQVLKNPDKGKVTEIITGKGDNEFIHLNLNGGDSAAYFVTRSNWRVINGSLKGEPNILLKAFDAEAYETIRKLITADKADEAPSSQDDGERQYFGGYDVDLDKHFCLTYDATNDIANVQYTGQKSVVLDFMKMHGLPKPDWIERWTVSNDPLSLHKMVDEENHTINTFRPSEYLRAAEEPDVFEIPPLICRLALHLCGDCEDTLERFMNWLAVAFQYRRQTHTAWVFTGTQGTGKNLFYNLVITPLIGERYAEQAGFYDFEGSFNGFLENGIFVFVDEIDQTDMKRQDKAMGKLKSAISSSNRIAVENKYAKAKLVNNRANFILASNKFNAVALERGDRRFNVAPRQKVPLSKVDGIDLRTLDDEVAAERQAFMNYLMFREADVVAAGRVTQTDERKRLMEATQNRAERMATKLIDGDFDFFAGICPDIKSKIPPRVTMGSMKAPPTYREAINYLYEHKDKPCYIPVSYLRSIFMFGCSIVKDSAFQYNSFFASVGIDIKSTSRRLFNLKGENKPTKEYCYLIEKVVVEDEEFWDRYVKENPQDKPPASHDGLQRVA